MKEVRVKIRFIGDIHGKIEDYMSVSSGSDLSIQVGDFGFGFFDHLEMIEIITFFNKNPQCRFIRGNHDHPQICDQIANFMPDGTIFKHRNLKMLFIGGARTPEYDRIDRTLGVDLFYDEECSIEKFESIKKRMVEFQPDIVVSHDFPEVFVQSEFKYREEPTRTHKALDSMFNLHQPKYWIGGHHHKSAQRTLQNTSTRFVCLKELETFDLEI